MDKVFFWDTRFFSGFLAQKWILGPVLAILGPKKFWSFLGDFGKVPTGRGWVTLDFGKDNFSKYKF